MRKYFPKEVLTWRHARFYVAVVVGGLGIFGLADNTLVNESVMDVMMFPALFVWIALFPYLLKPILQQYDQEAEITKPKRRRLRRFQIVLFFVFIVPFFVYTGIARGLPIIGHYLLASWGETTVTIKNKANSYVGSGKNPCYGEITVAGYYYFANNSFCLGNEGKWKKLKRGDMLRIRGHESPLGFSYSPHGPLW
jgi:hypothetical protein